jgi:hypothetical protein
MYGGRSLKTQKVVDTGPVGGHNLDTLFRFVGVFHSFPGTTCPAERIAVW